MNKNDLTLILQATKISCETNINTVIHSILSDWDVVKVNEDNIIIKNTNNVGVQQIEIHFSDINKKFVLQTIVPSFSLFQIDNENEQTIYLESINKLLINKEILKIIKDILCEYFYKIKNINAELYQIDQNEINEVRKKREEQRREKIKIKFDNTVKMLSENPMGEVVAKVYKDNVKQTGFSYRNQPAEILNIYEPESFSAYCEAKRLNKNLTKHSNFSYKAIDVAQITIK